MSTLSQRIRVDRRVRKQVSNSPALAGNPFLKGYCLRVFTISPKKPNSAERKVARVGLSNRRRITAYVPGEQHALTKHSVVLIRGGNVPDLPGVSYKVVRGKYDATSVVARRTKRSKYGRTKPKG